MVSKSNSVKKRGRIRSRLRKIRNITFEGSHRQYALNKHMPWGCKIVLLGTQIVQVDDKEYGIIRFYYSNQGD